LGPLIDGSIISVVGELPWAAAIGFVFVAGVALLIWRRTRTREELAPQKKKKERDGQLGSDPETTPSGALAGPPATRFVSRMSAGRKKIKDSDGSSRRVCGAVVAGGDNADGTLVNVPTSNSVLIGADPGEIFRCDRRPGKLWTGFVPFPVCGALPEDALHCDRSLRQVLLINPLPPVHLMVRRFTKTSASARVLQWCHAIRDSQRKGLVASRCGERAALEGIPAGSQSRMARGAVTSAGIMGPDELLLWLSARREGSWGQFRSAAEEILLGADGAPANGRAVSYQEIRFALEQLGHADFEGRDGEGGWRVAPPVLAVSRQPENFIRRGNARTQRRQLPSG
jgi:hypothetical protein